MDPVTIGLMGVDAVTSFINMRRGKQDKAAAEAALGAMGDAPNYTLSADYDRMVNAALNAPQLGQAAAMRGYGDQAAMAAQYGSRGIGALGAASRQQTDALNALEQQRVQSVQSALGTRAGAMQNVMDANVLRGQQTYDIERDRLLGEKTASQEAINAGISGFTNLGGGLLSGLAGFAMEDYKFGDAMQSFLNPSSSDFKSTGTGGSGYGGGFGGGYGGGGIGFGYGSGYGSGSPFGEKGLKTNEEGKKANEDYSDLPLLKPGDSIVTDGPEDHDKLEYLIAKMVKTSKGIRLKPVARSTGKERHQVNRDGEITVTNSKQEKSLQDSYERFKKTGNWKIPIRAMKNIFEKARFKD